MCIPKSTGRFTITAKVLGEVKSFAVHEQKLLTRNIMDIFSDQFPGVPMAEIYLLSVAILYSEKEES